MTKPLNDVRVKRQKFVVRRHRIDLSQVIVKSFDIDKQQSERFVTDTI